MPIAFGAVLSSWVTIQILRPILLGSWSEGFPLGVIPHLDWLSAFGYRYYNFFYNPFHAIGITLLFGSAFVLSYTGQPSSAQRARRAKGSARRTSTGSTGTSWATALARSASTGWPSGRLCFRC